MPIEVWATILTDAVVQEGDRLSGRGKVAGKVLANLCCFWGRRAGTHARTGRGSKYMQMWFRCTVPAVP
eukprot:6842811-Lingulodinium_polyedra.AAC.1